MCAASLPRGRAARCHNHAAGSERAVPARDVSVTTASMAAARPTIVGPATITALVLRIRHLRSVKADVGRVAGLFDHSCVTR